METNSIPVLANSATTNLLDVLRSIGMQEVATNVFSLPSKKKK